MCNPKQRRYTDGSLINPTKNLGESSKERMERSFGGSNAGRHKSDPLHPSRTKDPAKTGNVSAMLDEVIKTNRNMGILKKMKPSSKNAPTAATQTAQKSAAPSQAVRSRSIEAMNRGGGVTSGKKNRRLQGQQGRTSSAALGGIPKKNF